VRFNYEVTGNTSEAKANPTEPHVAAGFERSQRHRVALRQPAALALAKTFSWTLLKFSAVFIIRFLPQKMRS
jgi:hypothetical protein